VAGHPKLRAVWQGALLTALDHGPFIGQAAGLAMDRSRRLLCGGAFASVIGASLPAAVSNHGAVTPEMFGAKGDGSTNDTAAFAAMAEHVNRAGGGEIILRRATYIVGAQTRSFRGAPYAFRPAPILELTGCSRPIVIRGNGARMKCEGGLRFGTFSAATGAATRHNMPYFEFGELASPYHHMIKVERCDGGIEISDLELDGNLPGLRIGGPWGDTGHQIGTFGISLVDNDGPEILRNIHAHHHAVDGLLIDGPERARSAQRLIEKLRSEYNGRQGCSIVGGSGYKFVDCRFEHTGKSTVKSAPGAGVDIEAEKGKRVRNLTFQNCLFSNNHGPGLVCDQGDSEGAHFLNCTFIGTTNWAAWPAKPRIRFQTCTFVGPIVNCFGDAKDPERATRFFDCSFRDDPKLTPTGAVFRGQNEDGPIADLSNNPKVLFSRCAFTLTHRHALPWTTNVVIFEDCRLSQAAPQTSYPRGTFVGRNFISGKVDLYSAIVLGHLTVNGVRLPPTRA
jgi:hypothetical protein